MKKIILAASFLIVLAIIVSPATVLAASATPTAELLARKNIGKLDGTITAIGATSITVNKVTINITPSTILLRKFGGPAKLAEFSVGDQIMTIGMWNADKTILTARLLRNLSIQKHKATFVGVVKSLNATGFVVSPEKRSEQKVSVTLLTKYVGRAEKPITLADIKVGDKVMVRGLWDTKLNTVTEVTFVRDYSVVPTTPKTATPSAKNR